MARRKKKTQSVSTSVDDAVSTAFSNAEELKDELQSWFDNLPESFQNGSKGETLQAAIDALESVSAPDVPEHISGDEISFSKCIDRKTSRSDRLGNCIAALEAAADHARQEAAYLEDIKYNDAGELDEDTQLAHPTAPDNETDRDSLVTDLEAFADDLENVVSEWGNIEFPSMYG